MSRTRKLPDIFSAELRPYTTNTGWWVAERLLRVAVQVLIGVWLARSLGPDRFGLLSYVLAFVAIFGGVAKLGLESILVNHLVTSPRSAGVLTASALALRLASGTTFLLVTLLVASLVSSSEAGFAYITVLAAGLPFQASEVFEYYFQAQVQLKRAAIARSVQQLMSLAVKGYLLYFDYSLAWIATSFLLDQIVLAVLLTAAYGRLPKRPTLQPRLDRTAMLARESLPLMVAGVATMIYMKIDQVMIEHIIDSREVGLYAAAVRISEAVYFVPAVLTAALFPVALRARSRDHALYTQRLKKLYGLVLLAALLLSVTFAMASDAVISTLYSGMYGPSARILAIHVWASPFVFIGVAGSRWFVSEGLHRYQTIFTAAGAVANVALNAVLIPLYGATGAALATLVSYALAALLLAAIPQATRPFFWHVLQALNPRSHSE